MNRFAKIALMVVLLIGGMMFAQDDPSTFNPEDFDSEEHHLVFFWIASELPPAKTKAEGEYRANALLTLSTELWLEGFRLPENSWDRRKIKERLDKLNALREIDPRAAESYLDRFLNGELPQEEFESWLEQAREDVNSNPKSRTSTDSQK
ncbi:MAG: hypothetical protein OXI90_03380 [Gammaproteobacteria bacterium]|nr:hypothetical protein [Gammaproteobacteria bacterium]